MGIGRALRESAALFGNRPRSSGIGRALRESAALFGNRQPCPVGAGRRKPALGRRKVAMAGASLR